MLGKMLSVLIAVCLIAGGLYLWMNVIGGYTLQRALTVGAYVAAAFAMKALPKEPIWSKALKIGVLTAAIVWVFNEFFPVRGMLEWAATICVSSFIGYLSYIVFLEELF